MADRLLLVAAFGGALFPNGRATIDPGLVDPSSVACAGCHADEQAEHAGSRHAASYTNPVFQAALTDARMKVWCLNCHAPLGTAVAREGVSCVACHVREGLVLAREPVDPAATDVHAIRVEPDLADPSFCGGCHQFRAPRVGAPPGTPGGDPLQDTLREWRAWDDPADRTCQACHLPEGRHTFDGAHDPDRVRGSVSVSVERLDARSVRVALTTADVGHDVPTGDPFRRLILTTCPDVACGDPIATRAFFREFVATRRSWALVSDRTLPPSAVTTVDLDATGAGWWRLEYRFGDPAFEASLPPDEVGFVVAEGPLPP